MKKILHVSTECYPAAKAGGMGDVVGALPIYLPNYGVKASVILPKYGTKWLNKQEYRTVRKGQIDLHVVSYDYKILKQTSTDLGYDMYVVDIPELYDRASIYLDKNGQGFKDEIFRYLALQLSTIDWLIKGRNKFDGIHCHDHMTGLIPFFIKFVPAYQKLKNIPTFFTIHNGMYRGVLDWSVAEYFPEYDPRYNGMLDWDGKINSLATALKSAWAVNTVSPQYMKEIAKQSDTLNPLYRSESQKSIGILNGIDDALWNPKTDIYLKHKWTSGTASSWKKKNKLELIKLYNIKEGPLLGFIGRMAHQKGADIMSAALREVFEINQKATAIILGSGDKNIEADLVALAADYPDRIATIIAYDESLARLIYAASDFLMMPSRFEPCGLNQLYAYRYGTIPIVTKVGGLIDTVVDESEGGLGFVAEKVNSDLFTNAINRSLKLYADKKKMKAFVNNAMALDHTWNKSALEYKNMYNQYIK